MLPSFDEYISKNVERRYINNFNKFKKVSSIISNTNLSGKDYKISIIADNIFFIDRYDDDILTTFYKKTYFYNHNTFRVTINRGTNFYLSFKTICDIMDINITETVERYKKVLSNKDFPFIFIGAGGMNTNIFMFLHHMFSYCDELLNFNDAIIFDDDELEFHNMFRFYDLPLHNYKMIPDAEINNKFYKVCNELFRCKRKLLKVNEPLITSDKFKLGVTIGAPDIETRNLLYKHNNRFISVTHSGDDGYISIKPKVIGLERETYGKINISVFLLNVLKMTDELSKILTENIDTNGKSIDSISDELIYKINAKDYLSNKYKDNEEVKFLKEKLNLDSSTPIIPIGDKKFSILL